MCFVNAHFSGLLLHVPISRFSIGSMLLFFLINSGKVKVFSRVFRIGHKSPATNHKAVYEIL